jgi:hypothetical protein
VGKRKASDCRFRAGSEKNFRQIRIIEIMDTTLRDGEQTSGVSITPGES